MASPSTETAAPVAADARSLFAQGRRLQRRGTLAVLAAIASLLVAVFSLPSGVLAVQFSESVPLWQSVLVIAVGAVPLLAVLPMLTPGLAWLFRGTRLRESATAISSPSFGGTSQPGISRTSFEKLRRSLTVRGVVYGLLAIPTAIWLLVWVPVIVVSVINTYQSESGLLWLKVLVLFVIGGMTLPGILTALLAWRSSVNLRTMLRLRQLVVALSVPGIRSFDDLSQAMDLARAKAEATCVLAMSRGVLDPVSFASLQSSGRSAAPPQALAGNWLGRVVAGTYHVEADLGHGGMGAVYRARHVRSGEHVALKMLLPGTYESPEALRRLEREAWVARSLNHPGIVRIHECATTEEGLPFLVMELLEGESLQARLERVGALPWPAVRQLALQAGEGLAALHGAGLLHRDLKPSNIFLAWRGEQERAVLIDFGLAKRINASEASRLTVTGQVLGTPLYMSPEQARGEPVDVRSDVFGLGVVIYEMVAGVPPFFDVTMAQVYARLLNESVPPPTLDAPACPPGVGVVVRSAIEKRREHRFADVPSFLRALERLG